MNESHDDLMRELVTIFSAEADERLASIDARLAEFERTSSVDVRSALLKDVLRELHTLKGSAGAVNFTDAGRMAHALESLLAGIAPDALIDDAFYGRVYRGLEALRLVVHGEVSAQAHDVDVDAAITALSDLTGSFRPETDPRDGDASVAAAGSVVAVRGAVPGEREQAATQAPDAHAVTARPDETVRLSTNKLDSLMARVGELVVTRIGAENRVTQVRDLARRVTEWESDWQRIETRLTTLTQTLDQEGSGSGHPTSFVRHLRELLPVFATNHERWSEVAQELVALGTEVDADERRLGQVTHELEDDVRRTRMLPVSTAFDPLHRLVRTLSRDLGKRVVIEVTGADTEVDRSVLEQLRGPLTHIVRNAIDHGVEIPDERERLGKVREATIAIGAAERGGTLLLSLSDDGAGIDQHAVRSRALRDGLLPEEQLDTMSEREVLRLILRSGLSTRAEVTDVSGRGVGLDAVRETIDRLGGTLDVASTIGHGTTFTISVPLSVATTRCVLVRSAGHRLAMPINAVVRVVRLGAADIGRAQGRDVVIVDGRPVELMCLDEFLGGRGDHEDAGDTRRAAIIVGSDEQCFAICVDALDGTHDVVVKPLPQPFRRVRHAAGATTLGTGEVVVVINVADVVRAAATASTRRRFGPRGTSDPSDAVRAEERPARVLVVDDSIVTRMLEKTILEAAGYDVTVASDGAEAWRLVNDAPVDLIVSDVNMPKMDGLELVAAVRAHERLATIPVVLVTSLGADADHARAIEVGADAYIVKSNFSREGLLDAVQRLVARG